MNALLENASIADPLPTTFRSDGFDFHLVRRDGAVALLAKQKPQQHRPSFEVVIVQRHSAERIFGRDLPEREAMPPSESWGTFGWSYVDLAGAEARFNQLCHVRRKGHFPPGVFVASASKRSRRPTAAKGRTTRSTS